jgi:cytochrome c biogenesis protein CcmG/thiol:disulfide interchange protein DsbE
MRSLALLLVASCAAATSRAPVFPPAALLQRDDAGAAVTAGDMLGGQVAVVDFWASWCKECARGVPRVSRLAQAFAGRVLVVGVDVGESPGVARAAAVRLGIDYPVYLDPDLSLADHVTDGELPMVVVIDRDGRIVHRSRTVDEDTLAAVHALVGE